MGQIYVIEQFPEDEFSLELNVVDSDGLPEALITDAGTVLEISISEGISEGDITITPNASKTAGTVELTASQAIVSAWPVGMFDLRLRMTNVAGGVPEETIFQAIIARREAL